MKTYSNTSLYTALKESISRSFEKNGESRYANHAFWIKSVLIGLIMLAGYGLILSLGARSIYMVAAGYLLYNAGSTLFVVNVAHDASHGCIAKNRTVNNFLSYSWNFMGISKYLWEIQHHRSHHNNTGIPQRDVDIDETLWIRYSPTHRYRSYFRYQHLYAPFLYLLFGIFVIFVKDFIMLYSDKLKAYGVNRLSRYFIVRLIWTKLLYLFVSLMIPVWVLPFAWWQILIIHLVTLSISSGAMLIVLVVPHINEFTVSHEKNVSIKNQDDWVIHQLRSNTDCSTGNQLLSWVLGGLNTHLVHHLFPNICHIHYLQLTRAIKKTLNERGILFKERSFLKGVTDHFKFLKLMGMNPAEVQKTDQSSPRLSGSR